MSQLKSWEQLKAISDKIAIDQINKAGPHTCVAVLYGSFKRTTKADGKPLKRPVVVGKFYHCKFCHKIMHPMKITKN